MKTMQLPLPKKMEYMIRDTLIDKLQSSTLEKVINELLEEITTIDQEDPISVTRYKNAISLIYTRDELKEITENFILSFKVGKDLINSSKSAISGGFVCGGLCIALIGAAAGAAGGYLFSKYDETRIEELEGDTGWDCEIGGYYFSIDGVFYGQTHYCKLICKDSTGKVRHTEAVECPDGVSS